MVRKVIYVGGSGILLHEPLSDGRQAFEEGIVYDVENYADLHRLLKNRQFQEVIDEKKKKKEAEPPISGVSITGGVSQVGKVDVIND